MKNFILSFVIIIITTGLADAQVKWETMTMVAGPQPGLSILLPDTDAKFAESEWKDYMKPYGKVSSVKGSKETVVEEIHINAIGDGSLIKVYNRADEGIAGTTMLIWIDIGEGYLTEADSNHQMAEIFLLKFAHKVKVDLVSMDLENQKKQLEKLESNLAKLQKENENLHGTIETSKSKINDAEIGIPINETEQTNLRVDIESQRTYVGSLSGGDPKVFKSEQKKLAKLENELDKLEKDNKNFYKDIDTNKDRITKAEQDIVENLQEQESVSRDIESQKAVVEAVQNKLDQIKSEEF